MVTLGYGGGVKSGLNAEITDQGYIKKREGYNTFGEMVDVLWKINKQNKKIGFTCEYTVILPLKGTKPIYKKTLQNISTQIQQAEERLVERILKEYDRKYQKIAKEHGLKRKTPHTMFHDILATLKEKE